MRRRIFGDVRWDRVWSLVCLTFYFFWMAGWLEEVQRKEEQGQEDEDKDKDEEEEEAR